MPIEGVVVLIGDVVMPTRGYGDRSRGQDVTRSWGHGAMHSYNREA